MSRRYRGLFTVKDLDIARSNDVPRKIALVRFSAAARQFSMQKRITENARQAMRQCFLIAICNHEQSRFSQGESDLTSPIGHNWQSTRDTCEGAAAPCGNIAPNK